MKRDAEKTSRILKRIAIFSGILVAVLFVAVSVCLRLPQSDIAQTNSTNLNELEQIETQAVVVKENAAGSRYFLNRELPEYPDDKRSVFKIIEVIPHEACSIFPYLVDWGTEEEYNKNVPIGYEGLFWCAAREDEIFMFTKPDATNFPGSARPFTMKKKGTIKKDYLSVYTGALEVDYNTKGNWSQETDKDETWKVQNGYFEFVGEGNGLYYIPSSFVAHTESESGIHYEIQAISRTGEQTPKGELSVSNPAYYWAKDNDTTFDAKPKFGDSSIKGWTGYNYDLSFAKGGDNAVYRADIDKVAGRTGIVQGVPTEKKSSKQFDYFLEVDEPQNWGFTYYKEGNYRVSSATKTNNTTGVYVRIVDGKNYDSYVDVGNDINAGYFVAYTPEMGNEPQRYNLTFEKATVGEGFYTADVPDSSSLNDIAIQNKYCFIYAGEDKGRYDVPFKYYTDADRDLVITYSEKIQKVENNQGRYALTSTVGDDKHTPDYIENGTAEKDYSKIITNINFLNEWTRMDNPNYKAITPGRTYNEWGGWVFHEITDASEMGITKLNSVHKGDKSYLNTNTSADHQIGERIYVTNQRRIYRYYTRQSFVNNEWFKLLCYSNHPSDSAKPYSDPDLLEETGIGYNMGISPEDNLAKTAAQELIRAFDNKYRIEIVQMTPDKLTPEDVEDADLLYFSNTQGIEGMANKWDILSQHLVAKGLEALPEITNPDYKGGNFKYDSDITNETLFAIYKSCIYERTTALMVNRTIRTQYSRSPVSANLMKLYYFIDFFKEAKHWAYFMEDYPEDYRDTYSTIQQSDGAVRAYKADGDSYFNLQQPEEGTEAYYDFTQGWVDSYFEVWDPKTHQIILDGDSSFENDGKTSTGQVYDGETKFLFSEYIVNLFNDANQMQNIWKILNNRTGTGDIVVEITNAEKLADVNGTKVIYANEFDPLSFDVKYKIFCLGGKGEPTPLADVKVSFVDDAGNPVTDIDTILAPLYNTEYTTNVRSGFTLGGSADPTAALNPAITQRKVKVIATDNNGNTGEETVIVIVREAFNLN